MINLKNLFLVALFTASTANAAGFQPFSVNWSADSSSQNGILACDDIGPFNGIKVVVDGAPNSFTFQFESGSDAKVKSMKTVTRGGKTQTILTIESSDGLKMLLEQKGSGAHSEIDEEGSC